MVLLPNGKSVKIQELKELFIRFDFWQRCWVLNYTDKNYEFKKILWSKDAEILQKAGLKIYGAFKKEKECVKI